MREVSKAEFFQQLRADSRDIMPSHREPDKTFWEDRFRNLFGVTEPGWKSPEQEKKYFIAT